MISQYAIVAKVTATHCCVCRRRLTDAESVETGIGPICSKRFYDPLHTPTPEMVASALGHLQASDLPDTITDAVLAKQAHAREACNLLIYWASAHYEVREIVFKCSRVIRAFGYVKLADKLEEDRVKVSLKTALADPTHTEPCLVATLPYKGAFQADAAWVPGHGRLPEEGRKVRWTFPLAQRRMVDTLLGFHFGGELAFGDLGLYDMPTVSRQALDAVLAPFKSPARPSAATTPAAVRIVNNGSMLVEFWSPYNPKWVEEFKSTVDWQDRVWDPRAKCWRVRLKHIPALKTLALKHFGVQL